MIHKIISSIYAKLLKIRFRKIDLGRNITFYGLPNFFLLGNTIIKKNVTFISKGKYNYAGIKKECSIYVSKNGKLEIGEGCGFSGVSIVCWNKIIIGNFSGFGVNVSIWDTDFHGIHYLERTNIDKVKTAPINIGENVWIGGETIILKGVSIGDRSVIAAGSIVTKDIPSDEVWGGSPAKFIRKV